MLEMAGEKHIQFIGDRYQIIYTNNKDNAHKRFGLDYQKHMSDLSAKVFRTYNASITLQKRLHEDGISKNIEENTKLENKINFYN